MFGFALGSNYWNYMMKAWASLLGDNLNSQCDMQSVGAGEEQKQAEAAAKAKAEEEVWT